MVVVPTLRVADVNILLAYIFARDRYRPQEFSSLFRACMVLGVPLDRLPRELLRYSDDGQGIVHGMLTADPKSNEEPTVLPASIEVRPVVTSKLNVAAATAAGKRRRGRPRRQPGKDDGRGARSPSSALSPPPTSKRARGAREGKIVSYSSFGRPRRCTRRSGEGLGEEMASDDQRGKFDYLNRVQDKKRAS